MASKHAHVRKVDEPRLSRGEYGVNVDAEVGMVWDEGEWRPATRDETPSGWGVFDPDFGWMVDPIA